MIKLVLSIMVLILLVGNALAGNGYEKCIGEEKRLRTKETDQCSGLSYTLNPSGCYATRKALLEYEDGKCKGIGRSEHVQFNDQKAVPGSKPDNNQHRDNELPKSNLDIEQLNAENSRLKTEIINLKRDIKHLKNCDCKNTD